MSVQVLRVDPSILRVWRRVRAATRHSQDLILGRSVYEALIDQGVLGRTCLRVQAAADGALEVSWWPLKELQLLELGDLLTDPLVSGTDRRERVRRLLEAFEDG